MLLLLIERIREFLPVDERIMGVMSSPGLVGAIPSERTTLGENEYGYDKVSPVAFTPPTTTGRADFETKSTAGSDAHAA